MKELEDYVDQKDSVNLSKNIVRTEYYQQLLSITAFLDNIYPDVTVGQRLWHIRNRTYGVVACKNCGKRPARYIRGRGKNAGYVTCSGKCTKEYRVKSHKKTSQERYGVDSTSKLQQVKDKIIKTNLKNFGTKMSVHNSEIKKKSEKTMIKLYGSTNYASSKKRFERNIENFIKNLPKGYKLLDYDSILKLKHIECGTIFEMDRKCYNTSNSRNLVICSKCNKQGRNFSKIEEKLLRDIKEIYSGKILSNRKDIIHPYELDIYLPEEKIAIEINGVYYHSSKFLKKSYHQNKSDICAKKGIKLLHLWEDQLINQYDILLSIIKGYLGANTRIYARKCIIKEVSRKKAEDFLDNNHVQMYTYANLYLGLYFDQELIQIMSFKNIKKDVMEISRLCSKMGISVIGGASKLFKHFINNNDFTEVITFADISLFDGNVFEKIGMEYVRDTEIRYWYVNKGNMIRVNRYSVQKHKLVKEGFDKNLSESKIMEKRGFLKINGCRNKLYSYTR